MIYLGKSPSKSQERPPLVWRREIGRIGRNEKRGSSSTNACHLAVHRFICFIFSPWNKDPETKRGRRRPHRWRRCSRCRLWDPTKCSASNPLQCPFGPFRMLRVGWEGWEAHPTWGFSHSKWEIQMVWPSWNIRNIMNGDITSNMIFNTPWLGLENEEIPSPNRGFWSGYFILEGASIGGIRSMPKIDFCQFI